MQPDDGSGWGGAGNRPSPGGRQQPGGRSQPVSGRPERGLVCPECQTVAPAGAGRCPGCDYPLVLAPAADEGPTGQPDWGRKPDEPQQAPTTAAWQADRPPADGQAPVQQSTEELPPVPWGPGGQAPQRTARPVAPHPLAGGPQPPPGRPPQPPPGVGDAWWTRSATTPPPSAQPGGPGGGYGGGPGGGTACPQCRHANAPERVRCERCGAVLRPAGAWQEPPAPEPTTWGPPPSRRDNRGTLVIAGMASVLLVAVVTAGVMLTRGWNLPGHRPTFGGSSTTATAPQETEARLVPVDPGLITGEASSTYKPRSRAYAIANTLDGREDTAWNSDGRAVGRGVGIRLTYTFTQPVDLRGISIRNGYVKSKRLATVYQANGRVKEFRVTAGSVAETWALTDTPDPQEFRKDLGTTTSVVLEVVSVYPGDKYLDLAVTDITFLTTAP